MDFKNIINAMFSDHPVEMVLNSTDAQCHRVTIKTGWVGGEHGGLYLTPKTVEKRIKRIFRDATDFEQYGGIFRFKVPVNG